MMFKKITSMVFLFVVLGLRSATAQNEPVVRGVLFYLPTCPHCHEVMENVLPPLQAQYGDQLQILLVNASYEESSPLFYDACQAYAVPNDICGGVPILFIGDTYLMGSVDIPAQLPAIIEAGLAQGGIPAPKIEDIDRLFAQTFPTDGTVAASVPDLVQASVETPSWRASFEADPWGSWLAVLVLVLLAVSLVVGAVSYQGRWHHWQTYYCPIMMGLAGVSVVIASTLVWEMEHLSASTGLALAVTVALASLLGLIWKSFSLRVVLPLVIIIGLLVAGYLAYIEVTEESAVCGLVGNCNAVQQSDYAKLFGVLPIGLLGMAGYLLIGAVWWVGQTPTLKYSSQAQPLALALTASGVVFSLYLTYLELFVIKAVCAWCLTSAMLMLILLWLQLPSVLQLHPQRRVVRKHH